MATLQQVKNAALQALMGGARNGDAPMPVGGPMQGGQPMAQPIVPQAPILHPVHVYNHPVHGPVAVVNHPTAGPIHIAGGAPPILQGAQPPMALPQAPISPMHGLGGGAQLPYQPL